MSGNSNPNNLNFGGDIVGDFTSLTARAIAYLQAIVGADAPLTLKPPTVNDFALRLQTNAGQVESLMIIEDSAANEWFRLESEIFRLDKGGTVPRFFQFKNAGFNSGDIYGSPGDIGFFIYDTFSITRDFIGSVFEVDGSGIADETHCLIWDVSFGGLKRIKRGAIDSGGSGLRALCIDN